MSGRHHVACFLIRSVANLLESQEVSLYEHFPSVPIISISALLFAFLYRERTHRTQLESNATYRWHSSLTFKPSSHPVVNALGLPPTGVDAFESITLMAVEALCACRAVSVWSQNIHLILPHAVFLMLRILQTIFFQGWVVQVLDRV